MSLVEGPLKASDLLIQALSNENITHIFAVPGEENLDLVESIRKSKITLVVVRHEQAAGFMAATIGRLTGKAGVALATLGPGATNLTTAAAYAHLGAYPVLMITGQKPILKSKQGLFQVVNIVEMFAPITKLSKQLVDGGLTSSYIREAVRVAEEERPGATLLELPEDVARQEVPADRCVIYHAERVRRPIAEGKAIGRAVDLLKAAKQPLLLVGAGANRKVTSKMLRRFVDQLRLPFCDTQMGKGVIDSRSPYYMGTAAISDGDYIHSCLHHADLILLVGHDTVEKPPFIMDATDTRSVVHLNYFGAKVDEVYFPQLEVVGDIANAIWQLCEAIPERPKCWATRYFQYVRDQMVEHFTWGTDCCEFPLTPPRLVSVVRQAVPERGIVCLDNGLYKVWFARQYPAHHPNTLLLDNALATMGAGLPSAIAAKLTRPEETVLAVVGDGGFMMASQELITAVSLGVHITVVIVNDNAFGMIKWKQAGMGFENYGLDLHNPDFVALAEAYGARGHRVTEAGQLAGILQHCVSTPAVHVVEVPLNYSVSHVLQVAELKEHLAKTLKTPDEVLAMVSPEQPSTPTHGEEAKRPAEKVEKDEDPDGGDVKLYPFYLGSEPQEPNHDLEVVDKYTQKVAYRVAKASAEDIDRAIALADEAAPAMAALASYQRQEVLEHCVREFQDRFEDLAMSLCIEAGKPIKDSRGEVQRLIDTFKIAAEESVRIYGEYAPMDLNARTTGMRAITRLFPVGVVSMVSPFNFPLNLAAHKVAPALAVGCPFVLKPASRTPIGALIIGEVLSRAPHLPKGAFSILPCGRDGADLFTTDERLKLLSFTGSPAVGWDMKARAGKKPVVLELGGNAACVIEDYRTPQELDAIVKKLMFGAYYQSGQSCISVQRLFVRQDLYEEVKAKLIPAVKGLKKGDPKDEDVFIGPLIAEKEAQRVESWVKDAVSKGARLLVGGKREGAIYEATLLERVPKECEVVCSEVFGPVMVMEPYATFKEAVSKTNDSKYGLQAGVFTHDMDKAFYAFEHMVVGGVVVNQVPSIRVDAQAYGGVKESGLGREGVKYAMKDMCEERVMMLSGVGLTVD